ncbi:MAG TPA: hypothetical protein VMW18_18635 [Candidatus Binatia bacterium]|nr:hypothetical protein [Candidatus Binatia bacterium]
MRPDGAAEASAWLETLRAQHGISGDYDATAFWPFRIGPVAVPVPNFSWRRAAIQRHDLHHMVNGYPFNLRGEFQVAAWEFGAGFYPHIGARLLILPLVMLGVVWSPRRLWRAFLRGRRMTSLYRPEMLAADLSAIRTWLLAGDHRAPESRSAGLRDVAHFVILVLQSSAMILAPVAALVAVSTLL